MTENHGNGHAGVHVAPLSLYFGVFFALLALTGLTIWVALIPLG